MFNKKVELILSWVTTTILISLIVLIYRNINSHSAFAQILFQVSIVTTIPFYNSAIKPILLSLFLRKQKLVKYSEWLKGQKFNYSIFKLNAQVSNAFAIGFIPRYKIILIGEPLLKNFSDDNIKSLIMHEIAHHEKKHLSNLFKRFLILAFIVSIAYVFLKTTVFPDNKIISISISNGLFGLLLYYSFSFQKRMEYEADLFASAKVGKSQYIDFLNNLNALNDNKLNKVSLTHPTLIERIDYINENL